MTLIQRLGFISYDHYWERRQKALKFKKQKIKVIKPGKHTRR